MKKKTVLSVVLACMLAGVSASSFAEGNVNDVTSFTFHEEAALLDNLGIQSVSFTATMLGSNGEPVGQVAEYDALKGWLDKAIPAAGYQITGKAADPVLAVGMECYSKACTVNVWIRRDVYIPRVEGNQRYFLRLPSLPVAEFNERFVSSKDREDDAVREAGFVALRNAMKRFTESVIVANHPDSAAKFKHHFNASVAESELPKAPKPAKR